jgi:hypothetical protein
MSPGPADPPEQEPLPGELEQRVIYSLLLPAVSLAARFGISARDLGQWVQLAYLRHLRDQGMTHREAGEVMGVSERSAKRLGQQLRARFLRPEQEHNLPVRVEFILRAAPMSRARLYQVLRDVPQADLDAALNALLAQGHIQEQEGRTVTLRVVRSVHSRVRDTWLARIGGLNSLAQNLAEVVLGSFFLRDGRSLARTMSFHMLPQRQAQLEEALKELIAAIAALDQEATGSPEARPVRLSLFWAPFGLLRRQQGDPEG